MKFVGHVLCLLFGVAHAVSGQEKINSDVSIYITGVVIDSSTGLAIPHAAIRLAFINERPDYRSGVPMENRTTVADSQGRFVFENLPRVEKYVAAFSAPGFQSRSKYILTPARVIKSVLNIGKIKLPRVSRLLQNTALAQKLL